MIAAIRDTKTENSGKSGRDAARVGTGINILLVDHEDSFVHTLANYFRQTGATVSTVRTPVAEEVLDRLKPDLVVMLGRPGPTEAGFRAAKFNLLVLTEGDLPRMFENIHRLAEATGVPERGQALAARIRQGLDDVAQAVAKRPRKTLAFIVGRNPGSLSGLYVVGRGSYLNDVIKVAGGVNLFAETVSTYPQISVEQLLARQPDVIIDMGDMGQTTGVSEEQKRKVLALYRQYPALKSAVHVVASDIFVVPGPRVVEAAREFARMLE